MSEPQNVSGLMDQIHGLKTQLADAERRGAVKALRGYADVIEAGPRLTRCEEVAEIRDVANRVESGEMPL